jgi:hypothetical protein
MKKITKVLLVTLIGFVVVINMLSMSLKAVAIDEGDPTKPNGIVKISICI